MTRDLSCACCGASIQITFRGAGVVFELVFCSDKCKAQWLAERDPVG
jgi:hypothetical protein